MMLKTLIKKSTSSTQAAQVVFNAGSFRLNGAAVSTRFFTTPTATPEESKPTESKEPAGQQKTGDNQQQQRRNIGGKGPFQPRPDRKGPQTQTNPQQQQATNQGQSKGSSLFSKKRESAEDGSIAEDSGSGRDYSGQNENGVSYRDQELEKIVNRYKSIEGEWSVAQIEKFAEEITGFNSNYKNELKTSDEINYQAIKNMRTGEAVTGG